MLIFKILIQMSYTTLAIAKVLVPYNKQLTDRVNNVGRLIGMQQPSSFNRHIRIQ